MSRTFALAFATLAACGASSPTSPDARDADPIADAPPPNAAPTVAYLARAGTIAIDQLLPQTAAIDLGPDIAVGALTPDVSAGTTAVAFTVAPTAALGPRDVIITDGATRATIAGALTVRPSMAVAITGTPERGQLLAIDATSLVPDVVHGAAPFQLDPDLLVVPDSLVGTEHEQVLIAPGATLGPRRLINTVLDLPPNFATGPDALAITDATPRALVIGDGDTGPREPYATAAYHGEIAQPAIVAIDGTAPGRRATGWLFHGAGRAADLLGYRNGVGPWGDDRDFFSFEVPVAAGGEPLDLIAYDGVVARGGDGLALRVEVIPVTPIAQTPGHGTLGTAQPADACATACILTGTLQPGETQVFVVGPRDGLGGNAEWTLGLEAESGVDVHVGGGAQLFENGGGVVRPRERESDGNYTAPFPIILRAGTLPVTYALSLRRS
ncbi:MAG: hypothetical protein K8W52_29260 [Deltaproteobacteria bacterium]|nr:hypothetical protein [Deltaproteobacteria bacterium]